MLTVWKVDFFGDKALILPEAQFMVFEISLQHNLLPQDRKAGLAAFGKNDPMYYVWYQTNGL